MSFSTTSWSRRPRIPPRLKIYLDSVGCRLNQSEIESYARHFRAAGHILVPRADQADMMVLNTCAVTQSAVADSRQKVRQAQRAGVNEVVLTGCWSDIEGPQALEMPGVSAVVPNQRKDVLVSEILDIPFESFDLEPVAREPIPGSRLKTRAFIKAQDGCDNRCTFCVTTIARGEGRSRSVEEIRSDIRAALSGGSQEIVLTGVHLGSWGYDFEQPRHLKDLIRDLLALEDIPRLRLSSLEPWDLEADFFALWEDPRLCRHLHLPLQSGSAATLRRMARNTTPEKYSLLVENARKAVPAMAITTDVIVGFPGESSTEFAESLTFVEEMAFADAHIFTYSERPGTAAAQMPNLVQNGLRKQRNRLMREAVAESAAAYRSQFLGRVEQVLWESEEATSLQSFRAVGLTDNYLRVEAESSVSLWNRFEPAKLVEISPRGLRGLLAGQTEHHWFEQEFIGSSYAG